MACNSAVLFRPPGSLSCGKNALYFLGMSISSLTRLLQFQDLTFVGQCSRWWGLEPLKSPWSPSAAITARCIVALPQYLYQNQLWWADVGWVGRCCSCACGSFPSSNLGFHALASWPLYLNPSLGPGATCIFLIPGVLIAAVSPGSSC